MSVTGTHSSISWERLSDDDRSRRLTPHRRLSLRIGGIRVRIRIDLNWRDAHGLASVQSSHAARDASAVRARGHLQPSDYVRDRGLAGRLHRHCVYDVDVTPLSSAALLASLEGRPSLLQPRYAGDTDGGSRARLPGAAMALRSARPQCYATSSGASLRVRHVRQWKTQSSSSRVDDE